jgi:hypothetical protein
MKLKDVAQQPHLSLRCGGDHIDRDVTGGYAGDLLSDVIANSKAGDVWLTMQVHMNIVAVAVLKDLAGIILVGGREPAEETLERAKKEKVAILVSDLPAFETSGRLFTLIGGGA